MPRLGQDSHYFNHDNSVDDGVFAGADDPDGTSDANMESGVLMAQHELVSRALSPDIGMSAWTSVTNAVSGPSPPDRRLGRLTASGVDFARSESAISSRPGTPLSAPSNLPIPSNPSSFPEDQHLASPGPALVMPQIQISQRKPYTENGRRVGKLRIIFCGDSGSGKTTVLRTMVDRSPDIVHFENTSGSEPGRATTEINEVRASTQPYASWRILSANHQDSYEPIMERNLCLIDTPGYGLSAEENDAIEPILRYLGNQYERTNDVIRDSVHLNDDDFLSLIAAPQGGFTQIDAAVYCIGKELNETDLTFIHRLSTFTTIIPVITKADSYDTESLHALRESVKCQLHGACFSFFPATAGSTEEVYAVSCRDPELDASILMQESYIPDLPPSDLNTVLSLFFHEDNPARLRHYTARKFLAWKSRQQYEQSLICRPESDFTLLPSADFTVSRITEHTKQEDTKARLRIAAWASEMRTSFAHSQRKHAVGENYTVNEKSAEWLITRMNDYVEEEKRCTDLRKRDGRQYLLDESDPLGLLRLKERWSKRLKKAFKWCLDIGFSATGVFLCYHLWQRMNLVL